MSQFKFILDGIPLNDDPRGYETFTSRLFRDDTIKGLFITYPVDLNFYGDGYDAIVKKFDGEGYCSDLSLEVLVECEGEFVTEFQGTLFIRSLELNRTTCEAKVAVQDNTYSARIFNNKSILVDVRAARTKNELILSPTTQIGLQFFNTIAGIVTYDTGAGEAGFTNLGRRSGFDIMDVMTHLVEFITDGNVSVRSDWYDALPDDERYAVLNGKELRLGNANVYTLFENDFEKLYEWMQRSYNLFMTYEVDTNGRFIRIEDEQFYTESEVAVTYENVDNVIETIKESLLYSSVAFGGKETVDDQDDNNGDLPIFNMLGFKTEQYYIQGTCNIDNTLELTSDFITDSNIIQDVLNNPDPEFTDHDLDLFVVQYDANGVTPFNTVPFPVLQPQIPTSQVQIYNHSVLNSEIIQRYNLQGGIAKELGIVDDTAKAVASTNMLWNNPAVNVIQEPLAYDDDYNQGFDPNNNYGNGTPQGNPVPTNDSFYTVPVTGIYTFSQTVTIEIVADAQLTHVLVGADYVNCILGFNRYDGGGILKDTQSKRIDKVWKDINGNPVAGLDNFTTSNLIIIYDESTTTGVIDDYVFRFIRTFSKPIYAEAGDKIKPFFQILHEGNFGVGSTVTRVAIFNGAINEVTSTVTSGGLFIPEAQDDYFTSIYTFDKKTTREEMTSLLTSPNKAIEINGVRTFIDQVTLNHNDGNGKFQVITNNFNKQ